MKKKFSPIEAIVAALAFVLIQCATPAVAADDRPSPIAGQMTFFYYNDLPRAAAFYEKLLAVAPEPTPNWVRLYPLTPTSTLGLVNATDGALRPGGDKSAMATIVVDGRNAVDSWHARVKSLGISIFQERKEVKLDDRRSIYSFILHDPEGYAVEILTWVRTAKP
jgi:hypothetical protein